MPRTAEKHQKPQSRTSIYSENVHSWVFTRRIIKYSPSRCSTPMLWEREITRSGIKICQKIYSLLSGFSSCENDSINARCCLVRSQEAGITGGFSFPCSLSDLLASPAAPFAPDTISAPDRPGDHAHYDPKQGRKREYRQPGFTFNARIPLRLMTL